MDKELFDRSLNPTPDILKRLALGSPDELAENITLEQFYAILDGFYANISHTHAAYALTTDIPTSSAGTISTINANCAIVRYQLRRYGNVVSFSIFYTRTTEDSGTAMIKLCNLDLGFRPNSTYDGSIAPENGNANEMGSYYILTNGDVYINNGLAGQSWRFNATFIV